METIACSAQFVNNGIEEKINRFTSGQFVVVMRVQFSNSTSVPFRREVAYICGQKPLVFVRHHSPQDTHGQ